MTQRDAPSNGFPLQLRDSEGPSFQPTMSPGRVFSLVDTVVRSLDALMLHQRYMNELVAEAGKGNVASLLKALRIDREIVVCPSIARALQQAVLRNDQKLLHQVGRALQGLLNGRHSI